MSAGESVSVIRSGLLIFVVAIGSSMSLSAVAPSEKEAAVPVETPRSDGAPARSCASQGRIIDSLSWRDRNGDHTVVVRLYNSGRKMKPGYIAQISVCLFDRVGGRFEVVQHLRDFDYTDADIRFVHGSLELSDLDRDSLNEVSFSYMISNHKNYRRKFILCRGNSRYAIREYGAVIVNHANGDSTAKADSVSVDPSFETLPPIFRSYSERRWQAAFGRLDVSPTSAERSAGVAGMQKRDGRRASPACLTSADSLLVVSFVLGFEGLLGRNDTAGVVERVAFPLDVDGTVVERDEFVRSYYATVAGYLLRQRIDKEESAALKRSEYFAQIHGRPGCFEYLIANDFPDLEFNVRFAVEKRDGMLKITSISIAG